MPVAEGCWSWNGVNADTPHLSAREFNISLASDWPSDRQKTINICKDVIVSCDTWGIWQVLNPSVSIACLWVRVVSLKRVSIQLHITYQVKNLTSVWRQIDLKMDKERSTFINILSCSVTPEAPDRCSIIPFSLHAHEWGLWVLKWCQYTYVAPVSAILWHQLGVRLASRRTTSGRHSQGICCVMWHLRHLTGAQPSHLWCMPVTGLCGSWNSVKVT